MERQWFRLARQLGMSVARAKREISTIEFLKWISFESVEPGNPLRADAHAALIASTMANCFRDPKRKPEPYKMKDFMLLTSEPSAVGENRQKQLRVQLETWRKMHEASLKKKQHKAERLERKKASK